MREHSLSHLDPSAPIPPNCSNHTALVCTNQLAIGIQATLVTEKFAGPMLGSAGCFFFASSKREAELSSAFSLPQLLGTIVPGEGPEGDA